MSTPHDVRDQRLAEAQRRLSQLTLELRNLFGPADTVALLLGVLIGIIETDFTQEQAVDLLNEVVAEIERNPEAPIDRAQMNQIN